jgi:hypothetical protein
MSTGYFVRATFVGKLDKKTEERIIAVLERRGAFERDSSAGDAIMVTIDGKETELFPMTYSDIEWGGWENDDDPSDNGTVTEVYVDRLERAHHLAHELRFCGMSVQVANEGAA